MKQLYRYSFSAAFHWGNTYKGTYLYCNSPQLYNTNTNNTLLHTVAFLQQPFFNTINLFDRNFPK